MKSRMNSFFKKTYDLTLVGFVGFGFGLVFSVIILFGTGALLMLSNLLGLEPSKGMRTATGGPVIGYLGSLIGKIVSLPETYYLYLPLFVSLLLIIITINDTKKCKEDPYRFSRLKKRFFAIPGTQMLNIHSFFEKSGWNVSAFDQQSDKVTLSAFKTDQILLSGNINPSKCTKLLVLEAQLKGGVWYVTMTCKDKLWIKFESIGTYYFLEKIINDLDWSKYQVTA